MSMTDTARSHLRETIERGDSPCDVDTKVQDAQDTCPRMSGEQSAALWLYGWHWAGGDNPCCTSGGELRTIRHVHDGP